MERKISSNLTFFFKRIFPFIWFGFLALFLFLTLLAFFAGKIEGGKVAPAIIVPLFMAGIGYFVFKELCWGLMDEVYDLGDALRARRGRHEEKIPYKDIINVSYSMNMPMVIILDRETGFGKEIKFFPKIEGWPVSSGKKLGQDLISKAQTARK